MITKRLELFVETENDLDAIYKLLAKIYPPEHAPAREELKEEHNFYLLMRKGLFGGRFGRWLVKQKSDHALIGLGYIMPHLCTPDESAAIPNGLPTRSLEVEVGWALAPLYRKQGLGTEVGSILCHFALNEIKLSRVIAVTDIDNPISIRLMKRIGMEVVHLAGSTSVLGWITREMFHIGQLI